MTRVTLYLECRDKYIQENKQGLIRRYHAVLSSWKQEARHDPLMASCNQIVRPFGLRQFEGLLRNVASLEDYDAETKVEPLLKKPRI